MTKIELKVATALFRGKLDLGAQEPGAWPRAVTHIVALKKALEHAQVCDMPEVVRFRCDGCNAAEKLLRRY